MICWCRSGTIPTPWLCQTCDQPESMPWLHDHPSYPCVQTYHEWCERHWRDRVVPSVFRYLVVLCPNGDGTMLFICSVMSWNCSWSSVRWFEHLFTWSIQLAVKPKTGPPMSSIANVPAMTNNDKPLPYFILMRPNSQFECTRMIFSDWFKPLTAPWAPPLFIYHLPFVHTYSALRLSFWWCFPSAVCRLLNLSEVS